MRGKEHAADSHGGGKMAIEPLGSLMSMQAQPIQTKQVAQTAKPAAEYTDNSVKDNVKIDHSINVVENAKQKGNAGEQQESQQPSNEQIKKAVEQINKNIGNSEAIFGIHEATHRVTIKIVDKETKELIKELPPEKTLDMIAKVWEMAGLLVDERR